LSRRQVLSILADVDSCEKATRNDSDALIAPSRNGIGDL
jgi:hypothetical protein